MYALSQELELANRYLSTLDAVLAASPNAGISHHLAAAASMNSSASKDHSPAVAAATAAAAVSAAAVADPATAANLRSLRSGWGLGSAALDAHIRRTLEGQAIRMGAAEVRVVLCIQLG